MTLEERAVEGIGSLPQSLAEAVDVMEGSELVAEALGEHVFEYFIRNKRTEWADYKAQVTPWELDRYLGSCERSMSPAPIEPVLVYPDPPPPLLAQTLDLAGYPWKAVANASARGAARAGRRLVGRGGGRRRRRRGRVRHLPGAAQARQRARADPAARHAARSSAELEMREDLFDDFCLSPFHPKELEARLRHLFWRTGRGARPEIVEYGDLMLNLETYQAALSNKPLDLTYMEYELLKFFATHPGKVFTREQLLSRVWGYEYYGGARTVDVHVRRLRAKLGEEHAEPDPDGPLGRLPVRPEPR